MGVYQRFGCERMVRSTRCQDDHGWTAVFVTPSKGDRTGVVARPPAAPSPAIEALCTSWDMEAGASHSAERLFTWLRKTAAAVPASRRPRCAVAPTGCRPWGDTAWATASDRATGSAALRPRPRPDEPECMSPPAVSALALVAAPRACEPPTAALPGPRRPHTGDQPLLFLVVLELHATGVLDPGQPSPKPGMSHAVLRHLAIPTSALETVGGDRRVARHGPQEGMCRW